MYIFLLLESNFLQSLEIFDENIFHLHLETCFIYLPLSCVQTILLQRGMKTKENLID